MRLKVALGALVVATVVGAFVPTTARAEAGGPMTASNGNFAGTGGDDLLVIARDGDLLTHNRYALNDPGFESATDFDSGTAGVQTMAVGLAPRFDMAGGDDIVRFVGTFPDPIADSESMGAGRDVLDFANYASSASTGVTLGYQGGNVVFGTEEVIGSALDDILWVGQFSDSGVKVLAGSGNDVILGSSGPDYLDGGGGRDRIEAVQGDDTVVVAAPFPAQRDYVYGMEGDDTLILRGTAAADDLVLLREPMEGSGIQVTATDADHLAGGYGFSDFETVRVEAGDGDDDVTVDPLASAVVDGGAGDDAVALNAYQSTPTVAQDGEDRLVTLPKFVVRPNQGTVTVRLTETEHLSIYNETLLAAAVGPGGGPHVRTFRADGTPLASFFAYGDAFRGGVNVALGDLDGDFDDEIVTGAGVGGGPHVRVFRSDGADTGIGFFAYDDNFHGGVNVATADLDGDGIAEIITAPASNGGPHVRIWSGEGELLDEWFAGGFPGGGLNVARGPWHEQDWAEHVIVSAAGVSTDAAVLEADGSPSAEGLQHFASYPGFSGGATVARTEVDPFDPFDPFFGENEVVTAAGPGGGPHVKVFKANNGAYGRLFDFYAYDVNFRGGVNVTTCNPDGGDDEIVTAPGAGGGPHVRMFTKTGAPLALSFMAFGEAFQGGVRVACGGAETKSY